MPCLTCSLFIFSFVMFSTSCYLCFFSFRIPCPPGLTQTGHILDRVSLQLNENDVTLNKWETIFQWAVKRLATSALSEYYNTVQYRTAAISLSTIWFPSNYTQHTFNVPVSRITNAFEEECIFQNNYRVKHFDRRFRWPVSQSSVFTSRLTKRIYRHQENLY